MALSVAAARAERDTAGRSRPEWREGDRVLAPWEAHFLYFGVIEQIEEGQARIAFGDGDEGWVFVNQIRPVALTPGQKVFCRPQPGHPHWPAEIVEIAGERIRIAFENAENWVDLAALRIPTEPAGPDAVPIKTVSHLTFTKNLQPGTRVWAHWMSGALFVGTVLEANKREGHIQFDDGDAGWVKLELLFPLILVPDMRIMGRRKMGMSWYPGTITEIAEKAIYIRYDDGKTEWTTTAALMLPMASPAPSARVTRNANSGRTGWMVWLVVVVIAFSLRILMR